MDEKPLRDFLVYFKDGSSVGLKAASFKVDHRVLRDIKFSVEFHTESGEKGAAHVNQKELAAIIPYYDSVPTGQVFKVTLKSAKTIEIRAATFIVTPDGAWISFRDADGAHIDDVWVLASEVLACVPTVGLPPEGKYSKSASPSL
jgi:hypothetical protein